MLQLAATEGSKVPFYICGGLLVIWAVLVAGFGITRHETFPGSQRTARGVMAISAVLVLAAMASAVLTS